MPAVPTTELARALLVRLAASRVEERRRPRTRRGQEERSAQPRLAQLAVSQQDLARAVQRLEQRDRSPERHVQRTR